MNRFCVTSPRGRVEHRPEQRADLHAADRLRARAREVDRHLARRRRPGAAGALQSPRPASRCASVSSIRFCRAPAGLVLHRRRRPADHGGARLPVAFAPCAVDASSARSGSRPSGVVGRERLAEAHRAVARGGGDELVRAGRERSPSRRGCWRSPVRGRVRGRIGVGDRGDARLVVADVDPRLDRRSAAARCSWPRRSPRVGLARRPRSPAAGCVSDSTPAVRPRAVWCCEANRPRPRRANAARSSAWFAPPNRAGRPRGSRCARRPSTASSASSRNESNSSWIQRRLPGHWVDRHLAVRALLLQRRVRRRELALYFAASALRSSKLIATQISPSAWTSGPGHVVADVAEVQRVDLRIRARLGNAPGVREVRRVVADAAHLVARRVGAGRVGVLVAGRHEADLVELLDREQVADGLAHRAGLEAGRLAPLPIMRFSIMCVYSWPMTPASKSPSTHGG